MFTSCASRQRAHRDPRRRRFGQRGFTIVEVSVAMCVLALAIGTSLTVLARGFDLLDSARCISYASQIMQSEMEKMRLTSWGDGTTAGTGSSTNTVTGYPTTPTVVPTTNFFSSGDVGSRMTVTRTASDVHTGMIKVSFTISWTTHDGHAMSRTYFSYYGKNGLYDFFSM